MPLLDLSLVTTALLNLLKARVNIVWGTLLPTAPTPEYTAVPSDKLSGAQTVGLFLYYANEDPHFKNQPPIYGDRPPVRFMPMGLQLQYQLVAHAEEGGNPDAAVKRAQLLFGLALKTFHDYPCIDRDTAIAGSLVFPPDLQGTDNVFRITLKNVSPNDVTNFWMAGNQAVRLAAYYEVGAVLLEPDRPQLRLGRVLRYGVQVFVNGAPRLDTSRSTIRFRLPGEGTDRTIQIRPGEAAIGENIVFEGSDLNGDVTTLLIKKAGWEQPQQVSSDWGVVTGTDSIQTQVRSQAGIRDIVPGLYSAAVTVTQNRRMADGAVRAFSQTSNEVPFTVAPHITNPSYNTIATAIANVVTVTGGVFQHADVAAEHVRVIVGAQPVPLEPTATLTSGHFEIVSPTQLRIQFPIAGLISRETVPLRIIVNGAENAPRWMEVP